MNKTGNTKRVWMIIGAAMFLIALVAVSFGLLFGGGDKNATGAPTGGGSSTTTPPSTEPNGDEEESAPDKEKFPDVKFDDSGLVEMEVTTDPRIAAASAASVLMSVDTEKAQWGDEFRTEVLHRVMVPSEDYVGPGDQFQVKDLNGFVRNGDDLIEETPALLQEMTYSPTGWWWMLGDQSNFQGFASYGARVESVPIEVLDQAEMVELSDGASWTEPSDAITVNLNPGASFGLYWVRVETTTHAGEGPNTVRNPVALSIFCDPPEVGGVCGVVGLMTKYPSGWQTAL